MNTKFKKLWLITQSYLQTPSYPTDASSLILSSETHLCITGPSAFQVIDVSIPKEPKLLGGINGNYGKLPYNKLAVYLDNVFIAVESEDESYLSIINIADPLNPNPITLIGDAYVSSLSLFYNQSEYILMTMPPVEEQPPYLQFSSIANLTQPKLIGSYSEYLWGEGKCQYVVSDDIAYISLCSEIVIIDIGNVQKPQLLTHYATTGPASAISVVNDTLYTVGRTVFEIIDVKNPRTPRSLGSYAVGNPRYDDSYNFIEVYDNIAYLSGTWLIAYNVTDPHNAIEVLDTSKNFIPTTSVMVSKKSKDIIAYVLCNPNSLNTYCAGDGIAGLNILKIGLKKPNHTHHNNDHHNNASFLGPFFMGIGVGGGAILFLITFAGCITYQYRRKKKSHGNLLEGGRDRSSYGALVSSSGGSPSLLAPPAATASVNQPASEQEHMRSEPGMST